jgi:Predicted transmembrane and coiled-coil 2 protein.
LAGDKPSDIIQSPESDNIFEGAFAEIDAEAGIETEKQDKHNRGIKPEKSKDDKAKANGDHKPNGETKPDAEDVPKTPAELRKRYEGLKDKIAKEYEPQLKELPTLRAKLKELESRDESGAKLIQEEVESIKKRNAELEQHMRFVDYEKSAEYQEQFHKPYVDAWSSALRDLKGLTMVVEDPKTGEESRREVTQADIAYFANLDPAARRTEINRLFPEDKEEVKRHINNISTLAEKSHAAREKAKTEAEKHATTQTEAQRQSQANRVKLWRQANKTLASKYPKYFAKDEADAEGNAVFDKGSAFADLIFSPADLTADRIELLPPLFRDAIKSGKSFADHEIVKLQAIARNKLANHDRAIRSLKTANARIAELEKSLKEFEDSGPDNIGAGSRRRDIGEALSADEEFDAISRGD